MKTQTYRNPNHLVRSTVGDRSNRPVEVVAGASAPHFVGQSYYWTTPSGKTIVHHPNAYGYRTWYHHSTLAIEVGADWLTPRTLPAYAQTIAEYR